MAIARQASTSSTTVTAIMKTPAFQRGLEDVRAGVPFDWRDDAWAYERGRLFGHIAPLNMPLWIGGKLNPKAITLFKAAFERRLIV